MPEAAKPRRRKITKIVDYSLREYLNHPSYKTDEYGDFVYDDDSNLIKENPPPNPGAYGPRQLFHVALEQVNLVRSALAIGEGKLPKLPKGIRSDAQFCVLARALSNGWIPNVAEDKVILTHRPEISIDLKAATEALRGYGFKDVTSRVSKISVEVTFTPPDAMVQLISQFDAGELSLLIVPPSKEAEYREEILAKQKGLTKEI